MDDTFPKESERSQLDIILIKPKLCLETQQGGITCTTPTAVHPLPTGSDPMIYTIIDNHGVVFEAVKQRSGVNADTIKEFLDQNGFDGWYIVQTDLSDWEETRALLLDIDLEER